MIGGSVSLDEVAALAGTISYELLTALGNRLERVYINEGPGAERPI
jgi:alanine racemase